MAAKGGVIFVDTTRGNYSQRVQLGLKSFVISLRFNFRMEKWILDIADTNGVALIRGIPVLSDWPLAGRFAGRVLGLPEGSIRAIDMTGAHRDPDGTTLGADVPLFFIEN